MMPSNIQHTLRWDFVIFMVLRACSVSMLLCKMWTLKEELRGFRRNHCCSRAKYVGRKINMLFSMSGSWWWICNTSWWIILCTSGLISAVASKGLGPEQHLKESDSESMLRRSATYSGEQERIIIIYTILMVLQVRSQALSTPNFGPWPMWRYIYERTAMSIEGDKHWTGVIQ